MMTNGRINYWVHRASEIYAKKFWEDYYMQIRPDGFFLQMGDICQKAQEQIG